jgi:hypothetical protein
VREEDVMSCRDRVGQALPTRCVLPDSVSEPGDDPGLVLRDPARHTVAEPGGDDLDVLGEGLRRVADGPPARILERLRQVPVVERHEGLDAGSEQLVDEPVVEVEPGLVHPSASLRQHARPRDREAEGVEPEVVHQPNVVAIAVVRVAGDCSGITVLDRARYCGEAVPDALAATVLVDRALDLIRGERGAPGEARREVSHAVA